MTYNKKSIEDIEIVEGARVLVRCDFNVPLKDGEITSDKRIVEALPTIKYLLSKGAKVVLCSHMGKPKGKVNAKYSLSQIVDAVSEKLGVAVQFAPDCAKAAEAAAETAKKVAELQADAEAYAKEKAAEAEAKALMLKKNHDYGEAWRGMRVSSMADMILMKVYRTKQIEDLEGETLVSEGVAANYMDMMNYAVFALIKLGVASESDSIQA